MIDRESRIETENGCRWLRCTQEHPVRKKFLDDWTRVYHPDAKVVNADCRVGYDENYECPHCKLTWWVETDG